MKRTLLTLLLSFPLLASAQTVILTENFDSYSDLDYAGVVSPWMSTWSGSTGAGTDDCQVTSAESSSPSNSIVISGPQAGGTTDAMVAFPSDYTTGRYEFSMKFKVAAGMGGYFNCHSTSVPPDRWMAQVYFASDGTGFAELGGDTVTFNYSNGAWIDVVVEADLDNDIAHMWIDGSEVGTGFVWSAEALGAGTGNAQWGGVNLYSAGAPAPAVGDCEYYVDDISLTETTGVGIVENSLVPSLNVVPNPTSGNFKLNYTDMSMENATITVVDLLGKEVYSKNTNVIGNSTLAFDLNLRNGVYFITVTDGENKLTKKIIVKK